MASEQLGAALGAVAEGVFAVGTNRAAVEAAEIENLRQDRRLQLEINAREGAALVRSQHELGMYQTEQQALSDAATLRAKTESDAANLRLSGEQQAAELLQERNLEAAKLRLKNEQGAAQLLVESKSQEASRARHNKAFQDTYTRHLDELELLYESRDSELEEAIGDEDKQVVLDRYNGTPGTLPGPGTPGTPPKPGLIGRLHRKLGAQQNEQIRRYVGEQIRLGVTYMDVSTPEALAGLYESLGMRGEMSDLGGKPTASTYWAQQDFNILSGGRSGPAGTEPARKGAVDGTQVATDGTKIPTDIIPPINVNTETTPDGTREEQITALTGGQQKGPPTALMNPQPTALDAERVPFSQLGGVRPGGGGLSEAGSRVREGAYKHARTAMFGEGASQGVRELAERDLRKVLAYMGEDLGYKGDNLTKYVEAYMTKIKRGEIDLPAQFRRSHPNYQNQTREELFGATSGPSSPGIGLQQRFAQIMPRVPAAPSPGMNRGEIVPRSYA